MNVSTKEIQAQVNERARGWNFESKGQKEEKKDMHGNPSGPEVGVVTAAVVVVLTTTFTELVILCHILLKALCTVFNRLILATTLKVLPNMPIL